MKNLKKTISLFLCALLIFNLISIGDFNVFAENLNSAYERNPKIISIGTSQDKVQVVEESDGKIVNPLYQDENIKTYSPKSSFKLYSNKVFSTKKEAANYLKQEMVKRSGTIEFTIKQKNYSNLYTDLFAMAVADDENGNSSEGDYLFRHWSSYYVNWNDSKSNETKFIFEMEYLSTYKQEQRVDYEVKKVLDELNVYNEDEYTKTKAVHDFITENIVYDYALKKFSAYDGIVSKNVVCNGYATLTYKMMKDLGVKVRCITGEAGNGSHAWNIGKIGGKWYNIDNTWDAANGDNNYVNYTYFLRNNVEFPDHKREYQFVTDEFNTSYPMSKTSYNKVDYNDEKFSLNKLQKTIGVGKSFELKGIQLSYDDEIQSFTSSNENVAKVDSKGNVTGLNLGYATITAKTKKGESATCNVKVRYDLSGCKVTQIGNGEKFISYSDNLKPSVVAVYNNKILEEGKDYSLDYGENMLSGKGTTTVVGIGNYTGKKNVTFKIYPNKVSGVKVLSSTTNSLKIRWDKEGGVTGYKIYRATSKDGKYTEVATVSNKSSNTYADTGRLSGKTYYYKIRSYKTVDKEKLYGDYSSVFYGKTKYPSQVKNLKQNSSYKTLVKLSWDKASYASGYRVYRTTSKNGTYKRVAELSGSTNTKFTDKNVSSGKTYYYEVRAYRKVGKNRYYGSYSTILKASTRCNTPVITSCTSSSIKDDANKNGKVKIGWKKINGAYGYAIYRSDSENGYYKRIKTIKSGSTLSTYDEGLKTGKTYYYKINTYRTADIGNIHSYYSNVKSVKVK
ncbi:transglutaminase domain-containing protein [Terrisporobacter mayombei]|uniref:Fibronectin type-III domain-containing protein n=1 Tax=Terrisporobacter mayombei TaxID=1541 RepID=A0ABY9Q608_9FIRM|nr:transglutaminase domain-containing protein [Terrisporobacter mayombei]MCC3869626.1 Ig-like domain-containing protein [Terrisporobacter mayombei]WMT83435.1 hypothetical protein TEMA_39510 [Terrisporobacter mayombei]